ncbi:tail fiber domain-containing protein [Shewanella donghaensis]|uniref:tail fiber domain-containing protein n=1 Tax=Shewanella donghaensis TaxID=238836 RepID=UPI001182BEC7|nr:tail fiber domain-containing protein [Shewanella donghaensis]
MKKITLAAMTILPLTVMATKVIADQQIQDDLIVDGSACIGQDCVNGESFGFDTIRLKENNLRIRFEDTSNSASFPGNDWQLTANDSANGGANKFSIDDIDGGRTPFTIEAGAPSHSLYVDDGGRLGLGTNMPVVDIHTKTGNTPTLRLEQDGSSGFTPQTWDVAGNETNFFIRDASNGSTLPFRIRPGAPSSSIYIDTDGDVGLGSDSPGAPLHVVTGNDFSGLLVETVDSGTAPDAIVHVKSTTPRIILENSNSTSALDKNYLYFKNLGDTQMVFENNTSGVDWKVGNTADSFTIVSPSVAGTEFSLDINGNLTTMGTVNGASSRALKENILNIDTTQILDKIANLGVYTWNYIKENDAVTHLGPMAEDFHEAFGLNGDKTDKISYTDISGVALAAIKELKKESDAKDSRITALENKLLKLESQLVKNISNK